MTRYVIGFHLRDDGVYEQTLRFPRIIGEYVGYAWTPPKCRIGLDDDKVSKGAVKRVGDALTKSLVHPTVKSMVDLIVRTPTAVELYIEVMPGAEPVDNLPWEAMRAANRFIGFETLSAIARMQQSEVQAGPPKIDYDFFTPLKVMAVLSATGPNISAAKEWKGLHSALSDARAALQISWGVDDPLMLKVLVSDVERMTEIASLGENWIEVLSLSDTDDLLKQYSKFKPHFVHFFCHGSSGADPRLQIGSRSDCEAERSGSIVLRPQQLVDEREIVWLMTLGSCSGADNAKQSSMAKQLVRCGIPAAVGMREIITAEHSEVMVGEFYKAVFEKLKSLGRGQLVEIDWARALHPVRDRFVCNNKTFDVCQHWTIPVLYCRDQAFRVRRLGERTAEKMQAAASREELLRNVERLRQLNVDRSLDGAISALETEMQRLRGLMDDGR